ncbi:MAG TPA: RNA polymerase sigma-70 factor [Patescibacteria group bacterium]
MEQPDNDLILQFNHGDTEAFAAIYNKYHLTLYYFVKRFIPEREDAEDITADIFVKLWKLHANFDSIKNIEAFLYITGRNACLNFLRHLQKQHEKQKELLHVLLQEPAEGILQEDLKAEVLKSIHKEIEGLPRSCRRVFKMAYLEGLSNGQIAEILQINNQSVRNHKQRAIKLLRIALLNKNVLASAFIGLYFHLLRTLG